MNSEWTAERIAFMTEKWSDGWSAAQIGADLGVTRNAVIGKLNRLNAPKRYTTPKVIKIVAKTVPVPVVKPISGNINLLDLTNETCRWPTSHGYSCGVREADLNSNRPYCFKHARMAVRTGVSW